MIKVDLNSATDIQTTDLAGKSAQEVESLLKKNSDYRQVRNIGTAFTVRTAAGTILVFNDDKNAGTWVGAPIQVTGGFHNLQADGSYAPKG